MITPEGIKVPENYKGELQTWFLRGAKQAYEGVMPPQAATEAHMRGKDVYAAWLEGCEAGKKAAQASKRTKPVEAAADVEVETLADDDEERQRLEDELMQLKERLSQLEDEKKQLERQVETESAARFAAENEAKAAREEAERLRIQVEGEGSKGFMNRLRGS